MRGPWGSLRESSKRSDAPRLRCSRGSIPTGSCGPGPRAANQSRCAPSRTSLRDTSGITSRFCGSDISSGISCRARAIRLSQLRGGRARALQRHRDRSWTLGEYPALEIQSVAFTGDPLRPPRLLSSRHVLLQARRACRRASTGELRAQRVPADTSADRVPCSRLRLDQRDRGPRRYNRAAIARCEHSQFVVDGWSSGG